MDGLVGAPSLWLCFRSAYCWADASTFTICISVRGTQKRPAGRPGSCSSSCGCTEAARPCQNRRGTPCADAMRGRWRDMPDLPNYCLLSQRLVTGRHEAEVCTSIRKKGDSFLRGNMCKESNEVLTELHVLQSFRVSPCKPQYRMLGGPRFYCFLYCLMLARYMNWMLTYSLPWYCPCASNCCSLLAA